MPARRVPGLFRLFRGRLTVCGIPIKLDKQNCRCPDPRELCCDFFLFLPGDAPPSRGEPHGWEVVQLVGLQTLEPFNTRINTGFLSVFNNLTFHCVPVFYPVFHRIGSS